MLWLVLALLGAVSTSLTTVFAKIGIRDVKSNFATAYRTGVVIICCVIMCLITGNICEIGRLSVYNWLFLILSGIATGCSWLFYYRALKFGDASKVAPIDKSSFVLTSILFLIFFFDDTTKGGDVLVICMLALSIILMLVGTVLMVYDRGSGKGNSRSWLIYAVLSAVFASFVSLFVKIGFKGIPSDLGTLLRTIIVFVFASIIAVSRREHKGAGKITVKSWIFLTASGIATGGAWLFEYYALNTDGVNPVAVNSIGKLSILLTMLFSFAVLKEKFTKRSLIGLGILTLGIVLITIFSL